MSVEMLAGMKQRSAGKHHQDDVPLLIAALEASQARVRVLEAEVTEGVQAREQMLTEILPLRNLYKASLKLRNHLRGVDGQDKPYLVEFREALDEAWKVSKP